MVKVIGLMSGTSVDGIDAALVEITGTGLDLQVKFIAGETYAYPEALRAEILRVCGGEALSVEHLAVLDDAIAQQFALAANKIQEQSEPGELIGSHGQTVFHRPPRQQQPSLGYSLQLGRGAVIAHLTRIPTVSNFRAADIAARGQGAPLVSKIDACLLADEKRDRAIQNIGGISNVTYLPAKQTKNWEEKICGWDTGPGNVILDLAVQKLTQGRQTYDHQGNWAAQGTPCQDLVHKWLQQDFFQASPPKSTGRELFSHSYLEQCWQNALSYDLSDADWLATITELTAAAIVHSYRNFLPKMPQEVLLCGGGHHNLYLQKRLQTLLDPIPVLTTDAMGLNSDFKEAIAFAVLAHWRYHCNIPGNIPQVTGACQAMLLGEINF